MGVKKITSYKDLDKALKRVRSYEGVLSLKERVDPNLPKDFRNCLQRKAITEAARYASSFEEAVFCYKDGSMSFDDKKDTLYIAENFAKTFCQWMYLLKESRYLGLGANWRLPITALSKAYETVRTREEKEDLLNAALYRWHTCFQGLAIINALKQDLGIKD